jgi:ribose-phosphate pyrophosphokinase
MNNHVLYSLSNSVNFAQQIAKELQTELKVIQKNNFSDGEIDVEFKESVRGKSVIIVSQINMPYENLFELLLVCDAAKRSDASEIMLVIPYLPHSRQERRENSRRPISARVVADLLQNAGAKHIMSMDLHINAIEGFYSIPFDKLNPTELFIQKIESLNLDDLMFVSPDFGFMKKMEIYKDSFNVDMSVISKKRSGANKIEKMELIGDVTGKNVVIIDDMVDTAGTLVKASELLFEKGALSINVFATHALLSGKAIEKIAGSRIDKLFLSNTIDLKKSTDEFPIQFLNKYNSIDVSPIFAKAIIKKIIS